MGVLFSGFEHLVGSKPLSSGRRCSIYRSFMFEVGKVHPSYLLFSMFYITQDRGIKSAIFDLRFESTKASSSFM